MQFDHISYYRINNMIKSLKKYKNHLNIYSRDTLEIKKVFKKGVLWEWEFGFSLGFEGSFLCVFFRCTKFYDFWVAKKFFF